MSDCSPQKKLTPLEKYDLGFLTKIGRRRFDKNTISALG